MKTVLRRNFQNGMKVWFKVGNKLIKNAKLHKDVGYWFISNNDTGSMMTPGFGYKYDQPIKGMKVFYPEAESKLSSTIAVKVTPTTFRLTLNGQGILVDKNPSNGATIVRNHTGAEAVSISNLDKAQLGDLISLLSKAVTMM